MTAEDKVFQWASSNYLAEQMDDEVVISDDETMLAWIDDHKIGVNEHQTSQNILNDIVALADNATRFFNMAEKEK
tara:strand:- start:34 stop:258 length:225 start_codon:yes stop_codon:yes gene_type:complete